jgi:hypothetical protein
MRKGVVGERNLNADILMPKLKSRSRYHFALTFDDKNLLVVRDLGSSVGTRMLYGSVSEHVKPGFNVDFSAEGPSFLDGRPPIIKILNDLKFKLVVPRHDVTSDTYLANVKRFREGLVETEDLFAGVKLLSRAATELPTPAPEGIVADAKVHEGDWARCVCCCLLCMGCADEGGVCAQEAAARQSPECKADPL